MQASADGFGTFLLVSAGAEAERIALLPVAAHVPSSAAFANESKLPEVRRIIFRTNQR